MQHRNKKVALLTLGCRVNQSESAVIEGTLRRHGVSIVGLEDNPDYCIINTCTVTGKSDSGSRYLIRRAAKTNAHVIVTGCFSQLKQSEVSRLQGVCEVVPNSDKEKIISRVLGYGVNPVYSLQDRARPYLKVQDGCNFSCTYCAVPMARGRSRSLPMDEVVKRASDIVEQGYHEIVLTGIHLGSYGQDLFPKTSLARLISKILSSTSLFRIRLSSIEINEIDDELIELLGDPRICKHLHLPLQSGSDLILKLMNRNYTGKTFRKKLLHLSGISSDIAFGTDVIVGFPAEEHREFMLTHEMIKELPFAYVHTFPYSPRSGTLAANLKPQIAGNIISDRAEAVKGLSSAKKSAFTSAQANKILDVIAEEENGDGDTTATTSNYLKIAIKSGRLCRGSVVFVRSVADNSDRLRGVMIS
ncbi:MAG: tRNA (N(6)-L-threonylcarbamoyladenosine(37)-C(2))-methylthiotransferase MtaB [Nitrospirae bacterium]|nr:tRNA (N(6)-L-threonylcarbamoyladenosine(37)-C(2))-methylthiotransferase MtaB [Nitrospirota bacterium]